MQLDAQQRQRDQLEAQHLVRVRTGVRVRVRVGVRVTVRVR